MALQTERYKYIRHSDGEDEFFDLHADPNELDNLLADGRGGDPAEVLEDALLSLFAAMLENSASIGSSSVDPAFMEELRALGYIR